MTPVGHSLFGATIAIAFRSSSMQSRGTAALLAAAVVSANAPDLPFPGWGHERYRLSHSVFVGLSILGAAAVVFTLLRPLRIRLGGWRAFLICAVAWLSHYVLDSFYNHGQGIAIFWPFSGARLALPIPWFSTAGSMAPAWSWHAIRTCGIELLCYGAILCLVLYARGRSKSLRVEVH